MNSRKIGSEMLVVLLCALLVGAGSAFAGLTEYEGFDYTNEDTSIEDETGGTGWGGEWRDTLEDFSADDTSLDSAAFPFTPAGDRIAVSNNTALGVMRRPLGTARTLGSNSVFYASALVRAEDAGAGGAGNNLKLKFTRDEDSGGLARAGFGMDDGQFWVQAGLTGAKAGSVALGETYFLVAKIVGGDTDHVYMKAYASGDTVDASEVSSWTVDVGGASGVALNYFLALSGSQFDGSFDELRIGDTWADVSTLSVPDLKATRFNCAPEAALWGEEFIVDTTIDNTGGHAFNVKYYLSSDAQIDAGDHLLRTWNVTAAVNERVSLSLPATPLPGAGREVYLGIMVDADGDVPETNEGNNSNQGFGIDWRRINIGPPDAWADGSIYKYYTMLSPEQADCSEYSSGYQFVDPAGTSGNTWSILAGSLPPGMAMTSGGLVDGTSTVPGTYEFTLRASSGGDLDFNCQMVVHPARSEWFEDAKLGYWLGISSSDETSVAVIEAENSAYNASNQVAEAVAAGAKYIIYRAMHIEEVRYWPSQVPSCYSQTTNRDFIQEAIDAAHEAGIKILLVFGMDPREPGHYSHCVGSNGENYQLWQRKLFHELLLKGADGLWLDGGYWTQQSFGNSSEYYWMWPELEAVIRRTNPQAILITNPGAVANWWNSDDHGWGAWSTPDEGPADIDVRTFEQIPGKTHADTQDDPPLPANDNFIIPWDQDPSHNLWPKHIPSEAGYAQIKASLDGSTSKTWDDITRYFIKCCAVGSPVSFTPDPFEANGEYKSGIAAAMSGMGSWLDDHGEAVYGTRKGYAFSANCKNYSTQLPTGDSEVDKHFLSVIDYDQPGGSSLDISNFPAGQTIARCYLVNNPSVDLSFTQNGSTVQIQGISWSSGPATVVGIDVDPPASTVLDVSYIQSNNVLRAVIDAPGTASRYYPKASTNLLDGVWADVAHSYTNDVSTMEVTNLGYSATDATGTNEVIYLQTDEAAKFFRIIAE